MTSRHIREQREHDAFRLLAAAAVDGRIAPDDAEALEAHLAGCPACRADQRAMLDDHLWLATPMRVLPPDSRIREGILEAARYPGVPRTGAAASGRPWLALSAATMILAFVGIGSLVVNRPSSPAGAPLGSASATPMSATPALGGVCVARPAGLLAWWPFDGSGENLMAGGDATIIGAANFSTGIVGEALTLDGNGAFAEDSDPGVNVGTADFTASAWVRFATTSGEQVLIEQFIDKPSLAGWTLTKLDDNRLRLAIDTSDEAVVGLAADSLPLTINPQTWMHVAARRQADVFSVVVNGSEVARLTLAPGVTADLTAPTSLKFGRRSDDRGYFLNGQLDEVQLVVGRAESEDELRAAYKAGAAGTCRDFSAERAGYAGAWSATDCAQWWQDGRMDCATWGDGSALTLSIGAGDLPSAQLEDVSTDPCPDGSGGSKPWTASGTGGFRGAHLLLAFTTTSCSPGPEGWANPMGLFVGGDNGWFDPDGDGWGLVWHRVQ